MDTSTPLAADKKDKPNTLASPTNVPLPPSALIFPAASTALQTTLSLLRRHHLTLSNRLHSIKQDADFVCSVAKKFAPLPLVANERCGSWYVPPTNKAGSAYFKSTDGHFGEWAFSLRRLNVHLLEIIDEYGGCIVVDSTRKGKSMPDAMSKTVPIWIAVLNRLLFPERPDMHALRTPSEIVSQSEHAQIEERLDRCVDEVKTLQLELDHLRGLLRHRPLRPIWVTPAGTVFPEGSQDDESYQSVVLCTASSQDSGKDDPNYVQGAADDHESWGIGLDAVLFWSNVDALLSTSEEHLPSMIADLVAAHGSEKIGRLATLIKPSQSMWIADNTALHSSCEQFDFVVSCSPEPDEFLSEKLKQRYLHLPCPATKFASRQLRSELPKLLSLRLLLPRSPNAKILVTCPTGRDLAVGTALAVICLFYTDDGTLDHLMTALANKAAIKRRLSWIAVSMPDASPSRATLQSVNAFLMG